MVLEKDWVKKYILYIVRWQLSTPILAFCLWLMAGLDVIVATIIANLIGALIFFWVDRWIFRHDKNDSLHRKK